MLEVPQKILIVLPNNLGDVIMATPVLEGLKSKYPRSFCAFLVEEGFEAGIDNNPFCDEIIGFPRKKIKAGLLVGAGNSGQSLLQEIVSGLRNRHFDWVINLSQHPYVSSIVSLIKGNAVLGQSFLPEGNHAIVDDWSQYLYAIAFARSCNMLHAVDVYRRIAQVSNHRTRYTVRLRDDEKSWVKQYLMGKKINLQKKIMIFQPGAAYSSKRWPVENFIALGKLLVSDDWQIVITGAPAEKDIAQGIEQGVGSGCYVTTGETSFRQSIALCSQASGCVTGDSAQMHAAGALEVPVYAIFGPTNPVETGPYGNNHFVFSARCPKRPCFEAHCKTGICMRSVLPETVYSCIVKNEPGNSARCDVYKTKIEKDGDFKLIPFFAETPDYFSLVNASLTKSLFETAPLQTKITEYGNLSREQTQLWLKELGYMQQDLEDFKTTGNKECVRLFEQKKQGLASIKGIGEFWTVLLNIRLNSIPLLDMHKAIIEFAQACEKTRLQIQSRIFPNGL